MVSQNILKSKNFLIYGLGLTGQSVCQFLKKSKTKNIFNARSNDTIVPSTHLLEAKEYLTNHGLKIRTKMFKNCEHRIPVEGSSLGLAFLKKNLL